MSLPPGATAAEKNRPPVNAPVAESGADRQKRLDFTLSGHRARLLLRAESWIGAETRAHRAGVSASVVAGVLRTMYRVSDDGLRPSCTGSYGEFAATLDASRSQVAEAIKWLKAREWLDVLTAGPRGGVYAVQWPRIEEQVSEERGKLCDTRKEAAPQPKA
jgi:hypothetical protein